MEGPGVPKGVSTEVRVTAGAVVTLCVSAAIWAAVECGKVADVGEVKVDTLSEADESLDESYGW